MSGIEIIARGVFIRDDKILLCKSVRNGYFFLPGGHIEYGESGKSALSREIDEEIGTEIFNSEFIGIFEQGFHQEEKNHHEINLIYKSELRSEEIDSKEDQISFEWLEIEKLPESAFAPQIFAEAILKWHKDRKPIYLSRFD